MLLGEKQDNLPRGLHRPALGVTGKQHLPAPLVLLRTPRGVGDGLADLPDSTRRSPWAGFSLRNGAVVGNAESVLNPIPATLDRAYAVQGKLR